MQTKKSEARKLPCGIFCTVDRRTAVLSEVDSIRSFLVSREMGQFLSTALTTLVYSHPECKKKVLYFKKLSDQATCPSRGSDLAAGYDLYSAETVTIPKQGKALVKTDIAIALPEGCYGRVAPR